MFMHSSSSTTKNSGSEAEGNWNRFFAQWLVIPVCPDFIRVDHWKACVHQVRLIPWAIRLGHFLGEPLMPAALGLFSGTGQIPQISFEVTHQTLMLVFLEPSSEKESLNIQALNFHLNFMFSVWCIYPSGPVVFQIKDLVFYRFQRIDLQSSSGVGKGKSPRMQGRDQELWLLYALFPLDHRCS